MDVKGLSLSSIPGSGLVSGAARKGAGAVGSVAETVIGPVVRRVVRKEVGDAASSAGDAASSAGGAASSAASGAASDAAERVQESYRAAREQTQQVLREFYEGASGDLKSQIAEQRDQLKALGDQLPSGDQALESLVERLLDAFSNAEEALDVDLDTKDEGSEQASTSSANGAGDAAARSNGSGDHGQVSSAAEQRAKELGVDVSSLSGSGADGLITVRDVLGAAG